MHTLTIAGPFQPSLAGTIDPAIVPKVHPDDSQLDLPPHEPDFKMREGI